MKKLLLLLLIILPLTVTAADFKLIWDTYQYPEATMTSTCDNGGEPVINSTLASDGEILFTLAVNYGDNITCSAVATLGDKTSSPGVGSIMIPFPDLPAPSGVGVIRVVP